MANLFGGFSPKNAIKQVGSILNPTGGVADYDVFTTRGDQQTAVSQPSSNGGAYDGATYYDAGSGQLMQYNNGTWSPVSAGGGGSAPSGGSTAPSGGVVRPALNQAAVDNTQRTINEIPGLLEAALAAERTRYGNTIRDFNTQEGQQRETYDKSTTTNQQNYDQNYMASILSGIKGLGGLMSLLRGTGGGGGTAEDVVRDTVGGVTANDIREGADTRNENQVALDTTLNTFISDLDRKRRANEDTLTNNERAIRRDSNTQLQELYGKMAGFFGDAGRTAEANDWMSRAGNLTPNIAADSRTQVSAYDTAPVAVKAPELAAFAAPTQPNVVTAPDGQVGSGIFTISDRRRREQAPVGA